MKRLEKKNKQSKSKQNIRKILIFVKMLTLLKFKYSNFKINYIDNLTTMILI